MIRFTLETVVRVGMLVVLGLFLYAFVDAMSDFNVETVKNAMSDTVNDAVNSLNIKI